LLNCSSHIYAKLDQFVEKPGSD